VIELAPAVTTFAQEIQDLLDATLQYGSDATEDELRIKVLPWNSRYVVRSGPSEKLAGVPLYFDGKRVAKLEIEYHCDFDTSRDFLAVRKSKVQLSSLKKEDPLFRLDYQHGCDSVPDAHWNIHAERGALSALLDRTNPKHSGKLSKVHFSVGGSRHRPCLEDVLDMLLREFRVDQLPNADVAIAEGRERWRSTQIKVLVRDAPEIAASTLVALGYTVTPPEAGPRPTDVKKLRQP